MGMRLLAAVLLGFAASDAALAVCTQTGNCTCAVSTSGFIFGTYDHLSILPTDSAAQIVILCDSPDQGATPLSIALSTGNSGTSAQRYMQAGNETLLYNLYTDSRRSTIWGDDNGGGVSVSILFAPTNHTPINLSVYGRIPPRQNPSPGAFSDVITVTVTY